MLDGVRFFGDGAETHSMVMRVKTGTIRTIRTRYRLDGSAVETVAASSRDARRRG
jgi:fructose-1,6-bisphosphatase/sedoheptulose 1,7-bisphosphatase-like protein